MSTTKTSAQVPKLRFPGFEGEWKAAELGDYTQTITSGSRDWAQHYAETGSKFVRMTNLPRGGIQLLMDDMRYVALPKDSSEGTRTSLHAEDILISITAELGKIGWIPPNFGEAYINQHTALVRLDHTKADSRFVAHSLSSERMNRRINRLNDAGAKAGLNLPTIRELDTVFPTVPEQQKIAAFLTAVDGRIEQLSRKKALLEDYKKGVMQQLFTQTLRFQDDHGHDFPDWEEKTLGEVVTINPKARELPDSFTYIDLESVDSGVLHSPKQIDKADAPSRAQRLLQPQDILYQTVRPYQMNNLFFDLEGTYVASTGYAQLRVTKHNPRYIYHALHVATFVNAVMDRCTGTSFPAINSKDLGDISIPVPSLPEQTKIAGFLSALDGKIGAVGEQMRQTQAWKKGLLQQMFV